MRLKIRHVLIGFGITVLLGSIIFTGATNDNQAVAANYQQLEKFSRVMETVRRNYVEEVGDEAMIDGALAGMLSSLDPHSTYLDKEMYKQMRVDTKGEFGGLGIEISASEGGIRVVTPIEDTPADRAGIKAGDLIIKIEDQLAKDLSLMEGVKLMRGKPGTSINLTIFREGEGKPLLVEIVRAVIKVKSVKSDILAPGYAYLRITQFQERTDKLLLEAIKKLKEQGPLYGAVLDVRNNPGGLLDQAVSVSDLFLEKGVIVSTKSRTGSNFKFEAKAGDILNGMPLAVLINNGSASASEIVAGALKDNHRSVLVGNRTFGKGSVQTVIPLRDGSAMKLTTALYYTPAGTSIQATGIEPDIEVLTVLKPAVEETKQENPMVSERSLKGHLENGNKKKLDSDKNKDKTEISEKMKKRLAVDAALQRALDLLKGLHTVQKVTG
ncbi:MAG: S41 family peptidase [Mariprofundaceae bacterium]